MNKHGYGDVTNMPKVSLIYMVEVKEGTGLDDKSPMRIVRWFYDKDGNYLGRNDPFKAAPDPKPN